MRLVVGLRNPGPDYEDTRHNLGGEVVSVVASRAGSSFGKAPSRIRGLAAQVGAGDEQTQLLLPTTFMNESGPAVRAMLDYYRLPLTAVLVVHDDIDLPFARMRLQVGGGSGGHNGIRSVENSLGDPGFSRLKLGVGRPPGSQDPAEYVLRRFTKSEQPTVAVLIEEAADVVELWRAEPLQAQERASLWNRNG